MGKETGKIQLKDLAWRGFILKGIRRLKENREDLGLFASVLTAACCFPPPVLLSTFWEWVGGGDGDFYFLCQVYCYCFF